MKMTPEQVKALAARIGLPLPPELLAKIDGAESISVQSVPLSGGPHGPDCSCSTILPADAEQLAGLLAGARAAPFAVGDVVRLRPWAKDRFKWPRAGDRCIVTQVLTIPYRQGDHGTQAAGQVCDIALGFVDADGNIVEFLHDRRMFELVPAEDAA